ncbi:uncharacterized protein LOC105288073 isoform X8 [Ooceraea biroi]|uniref:uncharacterized protein LOC105288073 isoform X8 n=1 Tax=Ooceraea biroi TaxID=2015173 RepID=UPI0005BE0B7E|nr:uncharacterized protein LOC105288073 isoform X8 [Ooceraea biroi]
MATISFLGEDMILHILRTNDISIKDVNFSSTCKHFRDMIESSNSCWRWKCCQRIISVGSEEASRREILLDDLQKMEEEISKFYEKPKPKRRPIRRWPEMKFAVGMIVKLIDVPKIEGVIIGWRSPYLRNDSYIVWGSYAVVGENNKLYYFEEGYARRKGENHSITTR